MAEYKGETPRVVGATSRAFVGTSSDVPAEHNGSRRIDGSLANEPRTRERGSRPSLSVSRLFTRTACALIVLLAGCAQAGDGAPNPKDSVRTLKLAVVQPQTVSFSLPGGLDMQDVAVAATTSLTLTDRVQLLGPSGTFANASSTGTGTTTFGNGNKVGSIVSIPSVTLGTPTTVSGSITSSGSVSGAPAGVPVNAPTPLSKSVYSWTVPFDSSTTDIAVNGGAQTLSAGSYRNINVNGGTLTLQPGTYYVERLNMYFGANVVISNSTAPVVLYVRTGLTFQSNVTSTTNNLLLVYLGATATAIESPLKGTVVAPNASLRLGVGNTVHTGQLFGKALQLDPDVKLNLVPFAHWDQFSFNVVPKFECVQSRPDGTFAAVFGYNNPGNSPVTVNVGTNNRFTTGAENRLQPTTFLPGENGLNFAVGYTSGTTPPAWTLNGVTATPDTGILCTNPVLQAARDTSVFLSQPSAAQGGDPELRVGPGEHAIVSFDRAVAKQLLGVSRGVSSAKLKLTLTSGAGTDLEALPMTSDWVEGNATWNCSDDLDSSATAEHCLAYRRWDMDRNDSTESNPWRQPKANPVIGTVAGATVTFDVSHEINNMLGNGNLGLPLSWVILPRGTGVSTFKSREASGSAGRPILELQAIPITDLDVGSQPSLSFTVDTSIPTGPNLPPLGSAPRARAALQDPEGSRVEYIDDELIVFTDSTTELNEIKTRWNAVEALSPEPVTAPGLAKAHFLKVDLTRANTATLVPNLLKMDSLAGEAISVSSESAIKLLAIAADEAVRGTKVTANFLVRPAADSIPFEQVATLNFDDGPGNFGGQNPISWDFMFVYNVAQAWRDLSIAGFLRRHIDVAVFDGGFCNLYNDAASYKEDIGGSATGCAPNPDAAHRWHGLDVVNAGFAEPGNGRSTAGPGGPVSNVTAILNTDLWEVVTLLTPASLSNKSSTTAGDSLRLLP